MDQTLAVGLGPARSLAALAVFALACSSKAPDPETDDPELALPYAREVVSFAPGEGAGFGAEQLPRIVLGPPEGNGDSAGSFDVVSLGVGGQIVLGFGERSLVDGPGPDFVVFENAFYAGGDRTKPFAEPGEVALSEDGETFVAYECMADQAAATYRDCAGVTPTLAYDAFAVDPIDVEITGGDAFDLADLGLERARFVRIRDLSEDGVEPTAGFDLDAVGLIHFE